MATYRGLQTDFTGGELDPMIEANITHPLRTIALKKSVNTYHLPNGAVVKRPPETFRSLLPIDCEINNSTVMSIDGAVIKIFLITQNPATGGSGGGILIYDDDESQEDLVGYLPLGYDTVGCHIAVNGNLLIVVGVNIKLKAYTISKSNGIDYLQYDIAESEPELIGWKWGNPSSCMFAAGRLFLSVGNSLLASRTPEDGKDRFFDFSLADYKYKWKMKKLHMDTASTSEIYSTSFDIFCRSQNFSTTQIYPSNKVWYECRFRTPEAEIDNSPIYDAYYIISEDYWKQNNFEKLTVQERLDIMNYDDKFSLAYNAHDYSGIYMGDGGYFQPIVYETAVFSRKEVTKNSEVVDSTLQRTLIHSFRMDRNDVDSYSPEHEGQYYYVTLNRRQWKNGSYEDKTMRERLETYAHGSEVSMKSSWEPTAYVRVPFLNFTSKGYEVDITTEITNVYNNGDAVSTSVVAKGLNIKTGVTSVIPHMLITVPIEPLFNLYNQEIAFAEGSIEEIPTVYPTHAIEVHESDLDATEISWMVNLGRIIVGTPQAIFMSSDDIITPQTFHLIPTSYIGCSKLQPKILQSYILFTSKDEQKLYVGLYNDQIKGLRVVEVTGTSRHLFLEGIKTLEITDYPYITLFILTKDNKLRVGTAIFSEGNLRFAFSTWDFPDAPKWIFINRKDKNRRYDTFGFFASTTLYGTTIDGGSANFTCQYLVEYKEVTYLGKPMLFEDINEIYLDRLLRYKIETPGILDLSDGSTFKPGEKYTLIERTRKGIVGLKEIVFPDDAVLKFSKGITDIIIGVPFRMQIQLMQQLLPNNSGVALRSNHSVNRIDLQIYNSFGGEIWYNDKKLKDITQLLWGVDKYNISQYILESDGKYYGKYFSGVFGLDNPVQQTTKDELEIISDEIYPFNLLAVGMKYNITEVN